jgi:hypothetical protein
VREGGWVQRAVYNSNGENSFMLFLFYYYYITMSVYPVLESKSLNDRCSRDIEQFLREQDIQDNPVVKDLLLTSDSSSFDDFTSKIDELNPKFHGDANYVYIISTLSPSEQQKNWILRTYLVYQLLIILTLSLSNSVLYEAIFTKARSIGSTEIFTLAFRDDVPSRLSDIKLGIFGSLTPTSDIDIGFSGLSEEGYKPCLAYVVSRFELLFKIFTGKSCLDYDIESYADMITVPNPDESSKTEYPDLFYIDSSKLDWNDAQTKRELLPIAFNSIVRNAMIAEIPDSITLSEVLSQFRENTRDVVLNLKDDPVAVEAFETSKTTIRTFLNMTYEQQIQAYYDKVVVAENLKVETLTGKNTIDALNTLTDLQIISLMKAIGDALTLRMESYTCSPTVLHVVRALQAEAQKIAQQATNRFLETIKPSSTVNGSNNIPGKYITTTPAELCNITTKLQTAKCVIGVTGFILSALEQLGYMYRFHKVYCLGGSHPDDTKCKKKIDKYQIRLMHANTNIDMLQRRKGGARRKRSKKMYTRKRVYNRTNKYRMRHNKYYKTTHKKYYKKSARRV